MSANIEQIKAMLERTGKTNLSQKQEVDLEKEQVQLEGIKGNLEEIPSNVDLEKDVESWFFNEISHKINIEHTMYHYFQECARRYFELGLNARKEK